jgi:hypothetical protein
MSDYNELVFLPLQLAATIRSPFVKFLMHTCSYLIFLTLVVLMTMRKHTTVYQLVCDSQNTMSFDFVVLVLLFIWVLGGLDCTLLPAIVVIQETCRLGR